MRSMKKVVVGMSGGVDSSLSAALLKEQGYDVTGVFLECWRAPGCRVEEDRKDALDVALRLGIPFEVLDFKEAYREKVVEHFFSEYKSGRTPNPDVMCNKEIKFGLFYTWAMENGFDAVATGHYTRIEEKDLGSMLGRTNRQAGCLLQGKDRRKDQSYFLYVLKEQQLGHILFPIGGMEKTAVRSNAKKRGLSVADKPDSQGICFIGEIDVRKFLRDRLGENPGEVVDMGGNVIGEHNGLWFYTVGQRHGFTLKGKVRKKNAEWKHVVPPFYVVGKNPTKNRLIVGFGDETLRDAFSVESVHWINAFTSNVIQDGKPHRLHVRIRHTGTLYAAEVIRDGKMLNVRLAEPVRGVAEGQSAVLYSGNACLGGGVIR